MVDSRTDRLVGWVIPEEHAKRVVCQPTLLKKSILEFGFKILTRKFWPVRLWDPNFGMEGV